MDFADGYVQWARANAALRGLVLEHGQLAWWLRPMNEHEWEAGNTERGIFVGTLTDCVDALQADLAARSGETPWATQAEQRLTTFLHSVHPE